MKKYIMAVILIMTMVLGGCGSSDDRAVTNSSMEPAVTEEAAYDGGSAKMEMHFDEAVEYETTEESYVEYGETMNFMDGNELSASAVLSERKIIKTGFIYMESLEFDETLENIRQMISKYNGYTSYSENNGGSIYENGYSTRYARFTVKVPAAMFEEMYDELHTAGHVLNSHEGKEDVTSQFVDLEARLTTLYVQEERLLAILEKTENLEDVIELEYALQDTRYEIERYTTNLRNLQDRVSYSTIEINVQEVWEETEIEKPVITFTDRINDGLSETFREISDGVQNLIIFLVTQFPYILFTLGLVFIAFRLIKRLSGKQVLESARRVPDKEESEE